MLRHLVLVFVAVFFVAGCTVAPNPRAEVPHTEAPRAQPPDEAWKGPPLRVDVGTTFHAIETSDLMLSRPGIGPFPADAIGSRVTAVTFDMRGTALVTGPLYIGFEIGAGGGGARTAVLQTAPRVTTTDATSVHAVLGGLIGVESARRGPVQLRGELMAGGRLMTFDLAHEEDGSPANTPASLLGAKWMLQPRAKIERWVVPNVTLGMWIGADALHIGDWSSGLELAFHALPFDGR